jgi:NitT/TauT family transport system ATP-binding protein
MDIRYADRDAAPDALAGGLLDADGKIAVAGLEKRFAVRGAEVHAVRDVSLTIRRGEFVCLVGPSGCGKSTVLRILAGLERHTAGEVALRHDDPAKPLASVVFQEQSIFPWTSVEDNVGYGLRARGVGGEDYRRTVDYFVAKVGLTRFARAYPHQLSGGMKQRVAIARAFANDPEILLMDEPFGALDEQNKALLHEELLRIWEETGKTVLFVTHSIDEAITLADRVVVMSAQPGTVKAEFEVPLARPRRVQELRTDPEFGALAYRVWGHLRDEVRRTEIGAAPPPAAVPTPAAPLPDRTAAEPAAAGRIERYAPGGDEGRRSRRLQGIERLISVLSPIVFLTIWEALVATGVLDRRFFPPPSVIVGELILLARSGELWTHLGASLGRIAVGFAFGAAAGLAIGTAMGLSRFVRAALNPIVGAIMPIPKIALLPLILLLFGLGETSKYVTIAIAVFFYLVINTMAGVLGIDRIYWDVGKNYRASRWQVFRSIAFPGALPMIFAGLRLAWGVSLLVLVAAEFVGARSGVGFLIWRSWQVFEIEPMFVGLLVSGALGWLSFAILDEIERYLIPRQTARQK